VASVNTFAFNGMIGGKMFLDFIFEYVANLAMESKALSIPPNGIIPFSNSSFAIVSGKVSEMEPTTPIWHPVLFLASTREGMTSTHICGLHRSVRGKSKTNKPMQFESFSAAIKV